MAQVLIVDDNFANRQLLLEIVMDHATCDEVDGGQAAIDRFKAMSPADPYKLILLDIAMPDVDGLKVLREVRAIEDKLGKKPEERIPVVIITAYKELFVEAFRLGCTDYLTKPVDVGALLALVQKKLGIRP